MCAAGAIILPSLRMPAGNCWVCAVLPRLIGSIVCLPMNLLNEKYFCSAGCLFVCGGSVHVGACCPSPFVSGHHTPL